MSSLSPLERPAVLFASYGSMTALGEDGHTAIQTAFETGATGLRASVRATADGVAVLAERSSVGTIRRRSIARTPFDSLGGGVLRLEDALPGLWATSELLLEIPDEATFEAVMALPAVHALGGRLWLAHGDRDRLATYRSQTTGIRLLLQTSMSRLDGGAERAASAIRDVGIDGVLLPRAEWTGGSTTLFHRFGRLCVAHTAAHQRMITAMLRMGVDGVVGEHPDRLVAAAIEAADML